jgi:hypothetical protein
MHAAAGRPDDVIEILEIPDEQRLRGRRIVLAAAVAIGCPQQVWSSGKDTSRPQRSRISSVAIPTSGKKAST